MGYDDKDYKQTIIALNYYVVLYYIIYNVFVYVTTLVNFYTTYLNKSATLDIISPVNVPLNLKKAPIDK